MISNLPVALWLADKGRSLKQKRTFEHSPVAISDALLDSIKQCPGLPAEELDRAVERRRAVGDDIRLSLSAVMLVSSLIRADEVLVDLASRFVSAGCWVQYVTCGRHPVEYILRLKQSLGDKWEHAARRIVVVDGYTPHFGFTDTIHAELKKRIIKEGILGYVSSPPSYAGIHTGAAQAFNIIKKESGSELREPTLVIYEELYALVDLESVEQYRIFARHVLPSERLWGGMFTLFVESAVEDQNLALLKLYADLLLDSRSSSQAEAEKSM